MNIFSFSSFVRTGVPQAVTIIFHIIGEFGPRSYVISVHTWSGDILVHHQEYIGRSGGWRYDEFNFYRCRRWLKQTKKQKADTNIDPWNDFFHYLLLIITLVYPTHSHLPRISIHSHWLTLNFWILDFVFAALLCFGWNTNSMSVANWHVCDVFACSDLWEIWFRN